MKLLHPLLLASAAALLSCCSPKVQPLSPVCANPYLPLWEHMPDGEPRVFEDPDNPGSYRVYVTGSHDVRFDSYCGQDDRQWSAPVDNLTSWRDEGPVFTWFQDGNWSTVYAPDLVEVTRRDDGTRRYYLYPHTLMHTAMVCVSDRPDGPFTPVNIKDGKLLDGSCMGFDPGVLIDRIDDPSDPDYAVGFRAYGAWGIERSSATELDPDSLYRSRRPGPDYPFWVPSRLTCMLESYSPGSLSPEMQMHCGWAGLPLRKLDAEWPAISPDEDKGAFEFYEASSFRKVGNKYLYIYSGFSGEEYGLPRGNATLRYAYADSPCGPWHSGGVLVDARAPVLSRDGTRLEPGFPSNNTHGSLEQVGGQWYVFYHRAPRGFGFARQAMVAPVSVEADEAPCSEGGSVRITAYDATRGAFTLKASDGSEYRGAEVTSEGFNLLGLDPYNYYSAGYACYMSHPECMQDSWDIWDNRMDVTGMLAGDIVGYKYFNLSALRSGSGFSLFLVPKAPVTFGVWLDSPWADGAVPGTRIAEIKAEPSPDGGVVCCSVPLPRQLPGGKHALYLVAEGAQDGPLCDLLGFGFTRKGCRMDFPEVPQISIFVDGQQIPTPRYPVRATEANGITGYDLYEAASPLRGAVSASASLPGVEISVTQNPATVRCTWRGITKTYKIVF